jgi:hypothetical protein
VKNSYEIPFQKGRRPILLVGPSGAGKGTTRMRIQALTFEQMQQFSLDPHGFGFPPTIASRAKRDSEKNVYRLRDYQTNYGYQFNKKLAAQVYRSDDYIAGNKLVDAKTQEPTYYALPTLYFVDLYKLHLQGVFEAQAGVFIDARDRFRNAFGVSPFIAALLPHADNQKEVHDILAWRMGEQRGDAPEEVEYRVSIAMTEVNQIVEQENSLDTLVRFSYDTDAALVTQSILDAYITDALRNSVGSNEGYALGK